MDKKGYLAYLQALGNQEHYINSIQNLVALESELGINLDDYIPYNGDYSKVASLDSIMPTEKGIMSRLVLQSTAICGIG